MRFTSLLLIALLTPTLRAQDAGIEFFERKIRPVLVTHCYECHAATAKKVRGGLLLDSRDGTRRGGFNGPAVVPGDPEKSLLIKAVRYTDESMKMPKSGKLPAAVIADLEAWVKMGAPDPRDKATNAPAAKSWDEIVRERRKWWSLQPVKRPIVPTPKTRWSDDAIDRFLLAALETKGLTPASDADARTLIRRLSLVLTGLPPRVDEVEEFSKAWDAAGAKRQALYEALVDRLLASPHFGERWARHWMDVVRFTETHGNEWNYDVHHAWRYRDYLIRAFNDDVPYDQLVREHLAGDLLAKPRWNEKEQFNESVTGTAFYRFGEVNHDDCIGLPSIGYDLVDNQIDTLSKAFQAMTIACARCHDHKLDAISTRDYHGLLGILRSSRQVAHTIDTTRGPNWDIALKMHDLKRKIRHEQADAWLGEVRAETIAALPVKEGAGQKLAFENPIAWWRQIVGNKSFAAGWQAAVEQFRKEDEERAKFNASFTTLHDFRDRWPQGWQIDGHALWMGTSRSADFTVAIEGGHAIAGVLPAGVHTHALSAKLNGALRSAILSSTKKHISFRVLGDHASAVRLVSNNCQLNYRNFRYLTKDEPHWVTFPIPENADSLRVYVELMTKFDNPKFPDQLGTLGGDKVNYRVPWEKAAADPRSHFGITHVVVHDSPAPPKPHIGHMRFLLTDDAPAHVAELNRRYADRLIVAVRGFREDQASENDVQWLTAFLHAGYLKNRIDLTPKLATLIAEYRKLDAALALPRIVPGLADFGPGFEQPVLVRGDCLKPGEKTPRRFVEVLAPAPIKSKGSGRLELANLIASPDNPLTARVMVNRIWHHLFGAGLVRTVDDFGHVGELPSHPELLDYLADRFVAEGWSIKKLIRAIVLTRAFRLSHTPSAAMIEADPENRLLGRYPSRRMEAEAIRDAILCASGRLEPTLYGPSISAYREKEYADRRLFKGPLDGDGRRSIYIRVTLMEPPKFLEVFNFPGGKVCQGRRDVTNTPAQALAMLNDPFVHQQADVLAKRALGNKRDTIASRIDAMFAVALGRPPSPAERKRFGRFVEQIRASRGAAPEGVLTNADIWRDVGHALFNLQEFITIP